MRRRATFKLRSAQRPTSRRVLLRTPDLHLDNLDLRARPEPRLMAPSGRKWVWAHLVLVTSCTATPAGCAHSCRILTDRDGNPSWHLLTRSRELLSKVWLRHSAPTRSTSPRDMSSTMSKWTRYRIWRAPIGSAMSRCRGTDLCSGPRLCRKVSRSGPLSGSACRTNEPT